MSACLPSLPRHRAAFGTTLAPHEPHEPGLALDRRQLAAICSAPARFTASEGLTW